MLSFYLVMLKTDDERQEFTAIYEQYHLQMEKIALQILKEQSDAEDAVQNAFMQMICHFERIHEIPCKKLRFWIISIVKNEAIMILRKRQRVIQFEDWDDFAAKSEDIIDYMDLVSLFSKLPETYCAALEMKLLLGYTAKEIAKHLNISESAVNTRISRGKVLLQTIIEKEGGYL